ncbi:MAG: hypothetical protein HW400_313 [Candidatus Levybacteria bacterium]|nr:hypothetical protein [Candidatus Levybacteria bacterium]
MSKESAENKFPVQTIELGQEQLNNLEIFRYEALNYFDNLTVLNKGFKSIINNVITYHQKEIQTFRLMSEFASNLFRQKTSLKIVVRSKEKLGEPVFYFTDPAYFTSGGYFNNENTAKFLDILWPGQMSDTKNADKRIARASLIVNKEVILKPLT